MDIRFRRDGSGGIQRVVVSIANGVVTYGTVNRRPVPLTKTKRKQVTS